jgi:hypothetical protein
MGLPFTSDQFFGVFAAYNRAFLPVAVAFWLAGLLVLVLAWRDPSRAGRLLSLYLGALWLWNGLAYHALLFTRINPAAWLFAALFIVQGALFVRAASRRSPGYFAASGWRRPAGVSLSGYALAYPFLTIALGHLYPATPTFGVPCPTAILTIGVLLTADPAATRALAVAPLIWSGIGGSAAFLLGVPTDYALVVAGLLLSLGLLNDRLNR